MKKIYFSFKKLNFLALGIGLMAAGGAHAQSLQTNTYNFTGNVQTFTVPTCVTQLTITAYGAEGVSVGGYNFATGKGGGARGVLNTYGGAVLRIYVGGQNGYNGGGGGQAGGNGGGASDVRFAGSALTDRIIVAGGGGGAGGDSWQCMVGTGDGGGGTAVGTNFVGGAGGAGYSSGTGCGGNGGNSGGTGATGTHGGGGGGGGFVSGGVGAQSDYPGVAGNGSLGIGGTAFQAVGQSCDQVGCGGGGGGYFGGGGAAGYNCGAGRGGGGSSWTGTLANPTFTAGGRLGNGQVIIQYMSAAPNLSSDAVILNTSNLVGVCPGNAIQLSASNVNSYTWQPGGSNGSNVSVSPNVTTTYTVFGSNSSGCVSMQMITVPIVAPPVISISNTNTFLCLGSNATLTASGANTYTWMGASGAVGFNSVVAVSPVASAVYTLTGQGGVGCLTSVNVPIIVDNLVMSTTGNSVVCAGTPITMAASGTNDYLWSNGWPFASVNIIANSSAVYTVSGTNSNNCLISATLGVTVNQLPNVTVSATKTLVCRGESITLNASGASTYNWGSLGTGASISISPALNTVYIYTVVGTDANGCSKTGSVVIDVKTCTGVDEVGKDNNLISIYPNPSNGTFNIQSDVKLTLNLVNQLGQVIKTISLDDSHKVVTVTDLADGVYFITSDNKGTVINKKIVVSK